MTDEYADHLKAENERLRKSVEIATQIIGQCDCVFGDDGKLKRRWYESIFSAPAPLVEQPACVLGEPLMHGPEPYRWCATHNRLLLSCESPAPLVEQPDEVTEEQAREIASMLPDDFVEVLSVPIPELERDEPEPDLDAITARANAALPIWPIDENSDSCPVCGSILISFDGKRMLCPSCCARSLESLQADSLVLVRRLRAERAPAGAARLCVVCGKSLASGCDCRRVNEIKM